jgi:hypothetical protein
MNKKAVNEIKIEEIKLALTLSALEGAVPGTMVEDEDEDVWKKGKDYCWYMLDDGGAPLAIPHSSLFIYELGELAYLGISLAVQQKSKNGVTGAQLAESSRIVDEADSGTLLNVQTFEFVDVFGDTSPKELHELVRQGRYFLNANDPEELMWGCNDHIDTEVNEVVDACYFTRARGTDVVVLLKWIDKHEAEHHS